MREPNSPRFIMPSSCRITRIWLAWPIRGREVTALVRLATAAFLTPWMMAGKSEGMGMLLTYEADQQDKAWIMGW